MDSPRTMRALVITSPRSLDVREVPLPRPGPGQVLVRMQGCGLCGSNQPVWEGRPWFHYPLEPGAPGHEGWGVVEAIGSGVEDSFLGDRVAVLSYHALAEYDVADAAAVVRLPESLADKDVPGEPLGCAMNVFRRSDVRAGQWVAIVGVGFLGAVLTRLAAHAGARVIAISRRRFALQLAEDLGAEASLSLDENDTEIVKAVCRRIGAEGCDRVIEATGHQRPLDLAGRLVRTRGRLIIAGFHQDGHRQVDMQAWNWRGLDVINAHERDPRIYVDGIRAAVDAMASGVIDPARLLTHRVPAERARDAFEALAERPGGFLKAEVVW